MGIWIALQAVADIFVIQKMMSASYLFIIFYFIAEIMMLISTMLFVHYFFKDNKETRHNLVIASAIVLFA